MSLLFLVSVTIHWLCIKTNTESNTQLTNHHHSLCKYAWRDSLDSFFSSMNMNNILDYYLVSIWGSSCILEASTRNHSAGNYRPDVGTFWEGSALWGICQVNVTNMYVPALYACTTSKLHLLDESPMFH